MGEMDWEDFFTGSLLGGLLGIFDCMIYNTAFAGVPVFAFWLVVALSVLIGLIFYVSYPSMGFGVLFAFLLALSVTVLFNLFGLSYAANLVALMVLGGVFVVASLVVS